MRKLDTLEAWKCARALARSAFALTCKSPLKRYYRLCDQILSAGFAVPSNIAEGYALGTTPQFIRHLRIALGSAAELYTQASLIGDYQLAPQAAVTEVVTMSSREIGLLIGLLRHLGARPPRALPPSPFPLPH